VLYFTTSRTPIWETRPDICCVPPTEYAWGKVGAYYLQKSSECYFLEIICPYLLMDNPINDHDSEDRGQVHI
jgi:hypothetical protein